MRHLLLLLTLMSLVSLALAGDTEITGFGDASYYYNNNAEMGEFGLDQVEIDIIHQASEKTSVRADLEWVKNGDDFTAQVEQAFMTYKRDCGTSIMFGQFNAPIGFEMLDAPDMYQFSHSLVFDNGLPTNVTGLALSRDLGDMFDVIVYGCNGWDQNTEDNKNLTFGGRLGYTAPCGAGVGISAISGKETAFEDTMFDVDGDTEGDVVIGTASSPFTRTVFDVDLSFETGQWIFGGEYNMGKVTLPGDIDVDWSGFLVMGHYDVNGWLGFTGRYDMFDDPDGYIFGAEQTRSSLTFAPTFVLDEGFGALVEFRLDMCDEDVFTDADGPTDSELGVAFEMTYSW